MMRRRTATAGLMTLGLLASCSKPKPKIVGEQIPVLPDINGMDVAANPPQVVLPQATALADWPQPLANPAHAPGNVTAPLNFKPTLGCGYWHAGRPTARR